RARGLEHGRDGVVDEGDQVDRPEPAGRHRRDEEEDERRAHDVAPDQQEAAVVAVDEHAAPRADAEEGKELRQHEARHGQPPARPWRRVTRPANAMSVNKPPTRRVAPGSHSRASGRFPRRSRKVVVLKTCRPPRRAAPRARASYPRVRRRRATDTRAGPLPNVERPSYTHSLRDVIASPQEADKPMAAGYNVRVGDGSENG